MLSKFSKEQLSRLTLHTIGINNVLMEVLLSLSPQTDEPENAEKELEFDILVTGINFEDLCEQVNRPQSQSVLKNYEESDRRQREQVLSRICGRWMTTNNRCGIEISRVGEHFVLTYLKRNGSPSEERYILIWLDGDILYYGHEDRITVLALNAESDTLMISPGADYTRMPKSDKK